MIVDVFDAFRLSQTICVEEDVACSTPTVGDVVIIHNNGPVPFRCNGYTIPVGEGRRFRFGTKAWYIYPKRPGQWSDKTRDKRTMRRAKAWLRSSRNVERNRVAQ